MDLSYLKLYTLMPIFLMFSIVLVEYWFHYGMRKRRQLENTNKIFEENMLQLLRNIKIQPT